MKKNPSKSNSRPLKLRRVRGLAADELTAATGGGDGGTVEDGDADFMTLKFSPWRTRN